LRPLPSSGSGWAEELLSLFPPFGLCKRNTVYSAEGSELPIVSLLGDSKNQWTEFFVSIPFLEDNAAKRSPRFHDPFFLRSSLFSTVSTSASWKRECLLEVTL